MITADLLAFGRHIEGVVWKMLELVCDPPDMRLAGDLGAFLIPCQDGLADGTVLLESLPLGSRIEPSELNPKQVHVHARHHAHKLIVATDFGKRAIELVSRAKKLQRIRPLFE